MAQTTHKPYKTSLTLYHDRGKSPAQFWHCPQCNMTWSLDAARKSNCPYFMRPAKVTKVTTMETKKQDNHPF